MMTRRVALAVVVGFGGGVLLDGVGSVGELAGPQVPAGGDGGAKAARATVRVTARSCGRTVVGSGFRFGGLVVTNSHVVGDADRFDADRPTATGPGLTAEAEVVGNRPDLDLAFGRLPAGPARPDPARPDPARPISTRPISSLSVATADPVIGQGVVMVGYGGGRRLSSVEAVVSNLVDGAAYGSDGPVLLLDTATTVGFSGGPVVNLMGEVVGVLRAYDSATGSTIAAPVSVLAEAARPSRMHRDDVSC